MTARHTWTSTRISALAIALAFAMLLITGVFSTNASPEFLFNVVPQAPACTTPSFGPAPAVVTGNGPGYLTIADFNNDGKFDMAVVNLGDSTVSIQIGNGAGGFTSTSTVATPSTPNSVEAGDFNNDGNLDLAVPCYSGASCAVMLGDGAGGFTTTAILPVPGNARYAALADFNSDGKLDVAVTDQGKINIRVFFGDGAGNFSAPTILNAAAFPYGLKTIDLNGDGKLDLVTTNFQTCSISVLLGDGNGGFAPPVAFPAGCTPVSLAFADFNHDGKVDVVVGDELSNGVSVLLGNGAGGFGAPTFFATGDHATTVAAADFNGDNNPDIVVQVRFGNSGVAVLLGHGTGSFSAPTYFSFGVGPFALATADLNGDGKPDIAVADPSTTNVFILLNTCNPPDTTPPTITCATNVVGANGANQCSANVNPVAATATDNIDGTITPTAVRSDSQSLSAPYPVGTTTIMWTATDHAGNSASCQQTIIVNDTQPPAITCPAPTIATANASCQAAIPDVTGGVTASDNCSGTVTITQNPAAGTMVGLGQHTITLTATDASGNSATCTTTFTVADNTPPTITCSADIAVNKAAGVCSAIVNYSTPSATDSCSVASVICSPPSGSTFPVSTTTVTCRATDPAGNTASCAFNVSVVNHPPTLSAGGPYSVNEGGSIVLTASGSDLDGVSLAYAWDLDNHGSFETAGQSASFSAATLDGPTSKAINVRVTDICGASTVAQATVNVLNVAPTVGAITAPVDPNQVNTTIAAGATFTDPGLLDTHTAVWNWGDGSTSSGVVSETNGSGSVSGSHVYSAAGVYTVRVTVTDKDSGTGQSIFQYVVIYDASAGFVTGGGWINSPVGAYIPNPSLTGKATFGFVSKYERGATVPTGNTQFTFHVASMNFNSTSYEWLVIAGAKAQIQRHGHNQRQRNLCLHVERYRWADQRRRRSGQVPNKDLGQEQRRCDRLRQPVECCRQRRPEYRSRRRQHSYSKVDLNAA